MITPTQFSHLWLRMACLSNNLSAWYKVQSINILLSSLAATVAFGSCHKACRNLLCNYRHAQPVFLKGANAVALSLLIYPLRKSTLVPNCSLGSFTPGDGSRCDRGVCSSGTVLRADSCTHHSCLWTHRDARGPAVQLPALIGQWDPCWDRKLGSAHFTGSREPGKVFWVRVFCFLLCLVGFCFVLFCLTSVQFSWMNCCPFIKSQGLEVPLLCLTLGNSCHFVYPVALPAAGSMLARGRTAASLYLWL